MLKLFINIILIFGSLVDFEPVSADLKVQSTIVAYVRHFDQSCYKVQHVVYTLRENGHKNVVAVGYSYMGCKSLAPKHRGEENDEIQDLIDDCNAGTVSDIFFSSHKPAHPEGLECFVQLLKFNEDIYNQVVEDRVFLEKTIH
ncbi:MAG: hypothetical protein WBG46_11450 [Nonlabens sp.]